MRFDELRLEEGRFLQRSFEENDVDDVVPDVAFAVELGRNKGAFTRAISGAKNANFNS